MPKTVSVDGLGDYEFPDEATDGQITVYLRKQAGLTPHGTTPTKPEDTSGFDAAQPGVLSDTLGGMGSTISPGPTREDRAVASMAPKAVGTVVGKGLGAVGDATQIGLDAVGAGKPTQRVEQAIDLFAQPGKTPLENLQYAGGKAVDAAKRTWRESNPAQIVGATSPGGLQSRFLGNLLDSADTGQSPAGESMVQQRQHYADAIERVKAAQDAGVPVDPADRDLYARAKAGLLPKPEIDPATGTIMQPMPDRAGGATESVARGIAKAPAKLLETMYAPENAAIMGGQSAAIAATNVLPPAARALAQLGIGVGTGAYFLNDMTKGTGEAIGKVAGGDVDQHYLENGLPDAIATAAFATHMGLNMAKPIAGTVESIRAEGLSNKSMAQHMAAIVPALEKAKSNEAAGKGTFDGMNAQEIAAYSRTRKAASIAAERAGEPAPEEPLARDNNVDDAATIAKQMFADRPDMGVTLHEDASTLPADMSAPPDATGAYDPASSTVSAVRDKIGTASDLVQILAHEKAHGTVDIPAGQVAGFSEDGVKAELQKLAEEGRLSSEDATRLTALSGDAFVKAVKAAATGPDSPVKIAADEVMAKMLQDQPAEPGRFAQGMANLASKIPGIQLTEMDARALAARQARLKAGLPVEDRPVAMMGDAPMLPPMDRTPAPAVEAAPPEPVPAPAEAQPVVATEAPVAPVAQQPEAPPVEPPPAPAIPNKGDRVSFLDKKTGQPVEGVVYSKDKTKAAVRLDDGTKRTRLLSDLSVRPADVPADTLPEGHRQNMVLRRAVTEMTPEEARYAVDALRQERHTDEQTGLKNYKAWLEDPNDAATPVKVIADIDNFKGYNNKFQHAGGDKIISAVADGFRAAGLGDVAYRISRSGGGDESAFKFQNADDARAGMARARDVISNMEIDLEKDGSVHTFKGVDFSYGIGTRLDLHDADAALAADKRQRQDAGLRSADRESVSPTFREVSRDSVGPAGPGVESEGGQAAPPSAPAPAAPAPAVAPEPGPAPDANQSPVRLSSGTPTKHEQLVRPIMGDLVDIASSLMADKRNGIKTPEDLIRVMTGGMPESLAKEVKAEGKTIFGEAGKSPEERDPEMASVRKTLDDGLKPAKELGLSEDERTRLIQQAVDRTREDQGLVTTRKDAETEQAAIKLISNVGAAGVKDLVINRAKAAGGILNDTETVAAKIILQNSEANKAMMSDPALFAERAALANAYRMSGTEAGRAIRQRRWDITTPTDKRVKQVLYELMMGDGKKLNNPNAIPDAAKRIKEIRKFLEKQIGVKDVESIPIEKLTNQADMAKLVRDWAANDATLGMKMRTWYVNSLTSALKTHVAKVTGDVINAALEYGVHRRLEAKLNQVFGINGILPSDLQGMGAQFLKAQQAAIRDTANYLKTGQDQLANTVKGADWVERLKKEKRSFSGKSGAIIEGPLRLLGTESTYFHSLVGHVEAYASARMFARTKHGLTPGTPDYNAKVDEMVNNYQSDAWQKAMQRAEYMTFRDESGSFVKSMLALRRAHPNLSYVLPFVTTPADLIARGCEFVPGIGLIGRGVFRDAASVRSGAIDPSVYHEKLSRLAAAQLIGIGATIAVAASGATMFKDDNDEPWITGSEPPRGVAGIGESEARRRSLPAYTFINPFDSSERISYKRMEPIVTPLGLTVDLINMWRDAAKNKDFGRIMDMGKDALIGQVIGKTFLEGPSDWLEWLQNEPGAKFPGFTVATGMFPNALRQIPAALDPYVREQKQYGADAKQTGQGQLDRFGRTMLFRATGMPEFPGLGALVEPKVNMYGEEVKKTGSPLYRMALPFDRSGSNGISPEARALDLRLLRSSNDLPVGSPEPPTESGPAGTIAKQGYQMTPEDWAQDRKIRGQFALGAAKDIGLPDDKRKPLQPYEIDVLRKLLAMGGEMAHAQIAPKYLPK